MAADLAPARLRARARGPRPGAGEKAGRRAVNAGFPTVDDCRLGLSRIVDDARADLEQLAAAHAQELATLRAAALAAATTTAAAAYDLQPLRHRAEVLGQSTIRRQADVECDPLQHHRGHEARLNPAHLGLVCVLALLALLGGFVNFSVFQVLGLGSSQTVAVVLGVELLVTLAAHQLGARLKQTARSWGQAALALATAAALAASVAFLSVVRGSVFQAEASGPTGGMPQINGRAALGLFASLTALLVAVAADIGFAYHSPGVVALKRTARRFGRAGREVRRVELAARCAARDATLAEGRLAARVECQAHERECRRAQWQAELAAYYQGFRSAAPVELVLDLDAVRLPAVGLPRSTLPPGSDAGDAGA